MLGPKKIDFLQLKLSCFLICCSILFFIYTNESIKAQGLNKNIPSQVRIDSRFKTLLSADEDIVSPQSLPDRPALPDSFLSANRHFMIHYTTSGNDAIAVTDSNKNFIPDRIEKIANAFEKSYEVEIEQFAYPLPPSFEGGSKSYDIYIVDLINLYAVTVTEDLDSTAWEQKNVSSYILFDNDFNGPGFYFQGDNAIKTIAAHEFFHAIQLGYVFRKEDGYFFEMTAVWMEDQVFDEIDNYLYYLDYFFATPDVPLIAVSYTIPGIFKHIYGSCIFAFYIAENFGSQAIRQVWELMQDHTAIEAINIVLTKHGSNFESEFVKFSMWNFFTGGRARPSFSYKDSKIYPEIPVAKNTLIDYYHQHDGDGYFLTAGYFVFHPVETANYKAMLYTDYPENWRLGVVIYDEHSIRTFFSKAGKSFKLEDVLPDQNIAVIPCNVDRFANPSYVYLKHKPEPFTFILQREIKSIPSNKKPFQVHCIHPNPFTGAVTFTIKCIVETSLSIRIFNVTGQQVDRIIIDQLSIDLNKVTWHASDSDQHLPSGVYFCQFCAGKFTETKKLLLCR